MAVVNKDQPKEVPPLPDAVPEPTDLLWWVTPLILVFENLLPNLSFQLQELLPLLGSSRVPKPTLPHRPNLSLKL
jgi:hypothetical protein